MKKILLVHSIILLSTTFSFAQEDCKTLQAELTKKDQTLAVQKNTINDQLNKIQYYKEALNLLNSKITAESNEVSFKINSVIGNSSTGIIKVEGILINNGPVRSIQVQKANSFDPKGNSAMSYTMKLGNDIRIAKLLKDIPSKFTVEIKELAEGTPLITALIIDFHSSIDYKKNDLNVVFKNLDVSWE